MIEILVGVLTKSAPIIRFSGTKGGHLNAFGGGKQRYERGSHYAVPVTSKHPLNIITKETIK